MKWIRVGSIKIKLLIGFSAIFLLLFGVLFGLNQLLVDDFFLFVNEQRMVTVSDLPTTSESFDQTDDKENYSRYLRGINKRTGGMGVIYSQGYELVVAEPPEPGMDKMPEDHFYRMLEIVKNKSEGLYFEVVGNEEDQERMMIFVRLLPDGNVLFISKGLGIVNEVQQMFVLFLGIASLVVYMLGFILIYLFADRFTKPIIHLESAAKRMAGMDFSGTITTQSDDEIGQLVRSINSMASALSVSIEDLNAANVLLEEELSKERNLEKMRRRFVTDVSHELKNPISMIIGYADGIERGLTKTDEDRKFYAQVIKDEGNRMNSLVSDLLDLSSYESGSLKMSMSEMDLADLFHSVFLRYQHIAVEKDIQMSYRGVERLNVLGDQLRLEQVLVNLLDNAFKHVDEGGSIIADLSASSGELCLKLSNTGDMIPENELENVWNSFYQVDTSAAGNGLGLTIVRSIVEMHKGECSVEVEGGMNHFKIRLPIETPLMLK